MSIPIDLDEVKRAIREADAIVVTTGGKQFTILPPELMSDDQFEALQEALKGEDMVAQARCMVDDYDGFVAAGGSAMLASKLMGDAEKAKKARGDDSGESEASSSS